jgi:2'-hydroxyisoflavone reductase
MKILVIGGGVFVGKALTTAAVDRGHQVTLFNRGISNSKPSPGVAWIKGDRNGDLAALSGQRWDSVVDACAYFPRQVKSLLKAVEGKVGHYLLVSSVAAYADLGNAGVRETDPLAASIDPEPANVTPENYGPLKAMCEEAAIAAGPKATLLVRPGIIMGPWDPTGRFTYWVRRVARGGEVMAPGGPGAPQQLIDTRDLGAWMVSMIEAGASGGYNAIGPQQPLSWGEMLGAIAAEVNPAARFTWLDDAFLATQKFEGPYAVPLYIPGAATKYSGMYKVDGNAAFQRGLKLRTLRETIRDTAAWERETPPEAVKIAGISEAREAELLAAWKASRG